MLKQFLLKKYLFYLLIISLIANKAVSQQLKLKGNVVDVFSSHPLDGVNVITQSGKNTITDSLGNFEISVTKTDSIWFSYLGRSTLKYAIDTIRDLSQFQIALYIASSWLPEVKLKSKNYFEDSVSNREEFAKAFNFQKPHIKLSEPSGYVPGGATAGLDLDEIINMFRFKYNRDMLSFQRRLVYEEQQKYIDKRFSKRFVKQLTKLDGAALDSFMQRARPSYELLLQLNDLELGIYIQHAYKDYVTQKNQHRM